MSVVYDRHGVTVHHAEALAVLRDMPDASVHAVVCDPPYGLSDLRSEAVVSALTAWANGDRERVPTGRGFMGRDWDAFVPPPAVWDECLRVLKPGGHLAAFAGSRTAGLMDLSIRMAGFEIRDGLQWLHGQGFPKGQDVGKAITATEKFGGANSVRRRAARIGEGADSTGRAGNRDGVGGTGTKGVALGSDPTRYVETELTETGAQWQGWNTSLRPSFEPIILARKPLSGTVAQTVLAHGTGALNIDACRTGTTPRTTHADGNRQGTHAMPMDWAEPTGHLAPGASGRWPANVLLSHVPLLDEHGQPVGDACHAGCVEGCAVAELDGQSGTLTSGKMMPTRPAPSQRNTYGQDATAGYTTMETYGDAGGASRFFPTFRWEAKAPTSERPQVNGVSHPTTKPLGLIRWLVRLLTPPGGLVVDCFAGSGTTGHAARAEGMRAVLVERETDYIPLIRARLDARERTPATSTGEVSGDEPLDLLDLLDEESA